MHKDNWGFLRINLIRAGTIALLFLGHCIPTCNADEDSATKVPSPKVVEYLRNAVAPAYNLGNPETIYLTVSDFVRKSSSEQYQEADLYFQSLGYPSMAELLTESRVDLLRSGWNDKRGRLVEKQAELVIDRIHLKIKTLTAKFDKHPLANQEFPELKIWTAYEQACWDLHVMRNELEDARRLAEFCHAVVAPIRKSKLKKKSIQDADQDSKVYWMKPFDQIVKSINRRGNELKKVSTELRMYRLEDAVETLANDKDKANRIYAAFALQQDAIEIEENLSSQKGTKKGAQNPELQKQVQALVKTGIESAGDAIVKSQLLFEGLHWWERGRFGASTEAKGLLKPRQAMISQQAMFSLFMPTQPPAATNPFATYGQQSPQIDRRHHYIWAAEYRPFSVNGGSFISNSPEKVETEITSRRKLKSASVTKLSQFY